MVGRALGGFVAFGAVLVLGAPASRAQDVAASPAPGLTKPWGPRLSYSTTAGCLDEETFRHAVAFFHRGADPFDPNAADELRVKFKKVPGGYRSTVQKIPAQGNPWPEEESTGATCAEVFQDTARLASMRVPERPKATPAPIAPEPAPEPPPPLKPPDPVVSEPPPPDLLPPPEKKPQPPPMDLTIALTASALLTAGFTADVGPAFQIGAEARFEDWFALHLEVRGVLPGRVYAREVYDKSIAYSDSRYFDASQVSALLVPCLRFAKYFAGCAVGQGGFVVTQTPVETQFLPSFGVGPRFAIEVPLGDTFGVFGFGEALFYPDARGINFSLGGPNGEPAPNVVWYPSIVSGFFGVGLSVQFK